MTTQIPDRANARDFARYISEVTAAFAEGKEVEFRHFGSDGEWSIAPNPLWDNHSYDYRIAPEPPKEQWQPYTFETAPMTMKAKRKGHAMIDVARLTGGGDQGFWFNGTYYTFQRALDELEQLDGTPLGVKVESEDWPRWYYSEDTKELWSVNENREVRWWLLGTYNQNQKSNRTAEEVMSETFCTRITAAEAAELLLKGGAK